jgi:hypothetical protein
MEGKNKPFARMATTIIVNRLINDYSQVFGKSERVKLVSTELGEKLEKLTRFVTINISRASKDVEDTIVEFAIANNIYDMEIYSLYLEIKTLLEKLPFIKPLFQTIPGYISESNNDITLIIADLFKYYKQKVNLEHYKFPKMNEDIPLEEVLTEETIENLQTI